MNLSIIIVSYNVSSYLRQCLQSIYQSNKPGTFEIIVIDNYSHDNSCLMVKDEFADVKLIQNKQNAGFSKAVNIGLEVSRGKFICVLNPDTLIRDDTFTVLLDYLIKHPNVGCIGPKILNPEGDIQLASKRSFPRPLIAFYKLIGLSHLFPKNRHFGKYNLTYLNDNNIHSVDAISGSFMLFPRAVIKEVGMLDESFFMYGEDLDFCYRIKQAGHDIIYNPYTNIIHYKGESVKTAPYDMIDIFYQALYKFYNKHSGEFSTWNLAKYFIHIGIYLRQKLAYFRQYVSRITSFTLDSFAILFSFTSAIYIWYPYYYHEIVTLSSLWSHWLLICDFFLCWLISAYWLQLYKKDFLSYGRVVIVAVLAVLLSAASTYFIAVFAYSRAVLLITFLLTTFITTGWRIAVYLLYRYGKIKLKNHVPLFSRRAVVLGTENESMRIGHLLQYTPEAHFILTGYIDNENHSDTELFLGRITHIKGLIKNNNINEVIIPEKYMQIRDLINLINKLSDVNVNFKMVPTGEERLIGKGIVENFSGVTLMDIDLAFLDKIHIFNKRIFDIILSSFLILLTLPIQCYYILAQKFYKISIWSINNTSLKIVQFQSKIQIFQQLPYLYKILTGSLTFVGSQMVPTSQENPKLILKPGLTGLPHLKHSKIEVASIRKFENYYAMNYSVVFDIEILLKSIFKI